MPPTFGSEKGQGAEAEIVITRCLSFIGPSHVSKCLVVQNELTAARYSLYGHFVLQQPGLGNFQRVKERSEQSPAELRIPDESERAGSELQPLQGIPQGAVQHDSSSEVRSDIEHAWRPAKGGGGADRSGQAAPQAQCAKVRDGDGNNFLTKDSSCSVTSSTSVCYLP